MESFVITAIGTERRDSRPRDWRLLQMIQGTNGEDGEGTMLEDGVYATNIEVSICRGNVAQKYICPDLACEKAFATYSEVQRHRENEHVTAFESLKCPRCKTELPDYKAIQNHAPTQKE